MSSPAPAFKPSWQVMATVGRICERVRNGRTSFYLDFSPYLVGAERRLFSDRGHRFESREHADAILSQIRGLHARLPLSEAVGEYRAPKAKPNLVPDRVALWLDEIEASGDYAPYTLAQYRGYANSHFSFWEGRSVFEIEWSSLQEWVRWLRAKGLGPKSVRNVLASFRSFHRWQRRGREAALPVIEFPRVKDAGPAGKRRSMPLADRDRAIEAIPEADRGIFLAMRLGGIRPAEARAARVGDYDFRGGMLTIEESLKEKGSGAIRGATKTGETGTYPVSEEMRAWIEQNADSARRFTPEAPLFPNPRTGKPYGHDTLRDVWVAACEAAQVDYVSIYPAMKHSSFTHLAEAGVSKADIQALARHRDARTTEHYLLEDDERRRRALTSLEALEEQERRARGIPRVTKIKRVDPGEANTP